MKRREFLIGAGAAIGAGALVSCGGATPPPVAPPSGTSSWDDVKAQFQLAPGLAHMSGFFLASHPRAVREAIDKYRRGLDDNPFEYIETNIAELEGGVRDAAASYTGARADDLALTDSTTMGLGLLYGGFALAPGQEILSTTHDHIVTTVACQLRAQRSNAPFRQVPVYGDPAQAKAGAIVDALIAAIKPETRVVAITWVHSGTGVKLPVRAIADALARVNASRSDADRAILCVDGVHGFGLEDVALPDLGCDFFVAGCHKWILGPRGTGLVWGRAQAWPLVAPTIPTFDPMWRKGPLDQMPRASMVTPGGFHSFEHRWALADAFRFDLSIGKARIAARVRELNHHLRAELAKLPRVKVITPLDDELAAGITCFAVDGLAPDETVKRLRAKGVVASVTPSFYVPLYARLSAGLVTVERDVDRAIDAVRSLSPG